MQYKVISFYSEPEEDSTYYTKHARRFTWECKKHNLDYHIEELKSKGNYFKNCRMKAGFIHECMNKFKMPLLWLDIDTFIRRQPNMSNLSSLDCGGVESIQGSPGGIFAHCLFFNNTPTSLALLKDWKNLCDNETRAHVGDHSVFARALRNHKNIKRGFINDFTKYSLAPVSEISSKTRR
jgi:hypothetical protein